MKIEFHVKLEFFETQVVWKFDINVFIVIGKYNMLPDKYVLSLTMLLTVYLWLKHVNKDTFIDKKLIHQRYTTFAYGNLSAPTLRQVGRLLHTRQS